jgi:hypothetical protein
MDCMCCLKWFCQEYLWQVTQGDQDQQGQQGQIQRQQPNQSKKGRNAGNDRWKLLDSLRPTSTTGGPGHPFYNLVQLAKLLNV